MSILLLASATSFLCLMWCHLIKEYKEIFKAKVTCRLHREIPNVDNIKQCWTAGIAFLSLGAGQTPRWTGIFLLFSDDTFRLAFFFLRSLYTVSMFGIIPGVARTEEERVKERHTNLMKNFARPHYYTTLVGSRLVYVCTVYMCTLQQYSWQGENYILGAKWCIYHLYIHLSTDLSYMKKSWNALSGFLLLLNL